MSIHEDRLRWNRRYSEAGFTADWAPDVIVAERLPGLGTGRALDVACGIGANALFLAKRGWEVDAVDVSDVAIERLRVAATSEGVLDTIHLGLGDVETLPVQVATYDLVLCFRFLSRAAAPKLSAALKPGGALIYQTYTTAHRAKRPSFPEAWCLKPGELRSLFADLEVELYEETEGERGATATLVARSRG